MEFFKHNTKIGFMKMRRYTTIASIVICLGSMILLFVNGLNFGLDFTGGTQLEVRFAQPVAVSEISDHLQETLGLDDTKITHYGSTRDLLIRFAAVANEGEEKLSKQVVDSLAQTWPSVDLRREEFVGAEVGEQLAEQGGLAVLVALLATMVYIALRFEYRFAVAAAVALLHDPIVILGIFAGLHLEFDLATLAAILAVMGYSINDTIVVYDRIRENFRKIRKATVSDIIDTSINQTLSRTLMTSLLTLIVVVALLIFGGESLRSFSVALTVGIIIGTYSSIYVAGALALNMGLSRRDLLPRAQVSEIEGSP